MLASDPEAPDWFIGFNWQLTSGAGGVLLDVLALLDELVLGGAAGEAALGRSTQLGSETRGVAGSDS